jgi:glycosyltransferase involved in cell wall biosynthesis
MPRVRRAALSFFVDASVRRSDAVIAVSSFTRDEILTKLRVDGTKIYVVHSAAKIVHSDGLPASPGMVPAGPYFVAFSSATSNKNIPRLLDAYSRARANGDVHHRLVLLGHAPDVGPHVAPDDIPGVTRLGYLPDRDADTVVRGADGLLFPSLYEGFGLPILEAMGAGVAVACSRRASLPEVAGDAALYFDPDNADEIADAIRRLSGDAALRRRLAVLGYRQAAKFTWLKTAEATLAVYRTTLARPIS